METINDIITDIRRRNDGGVPLDGESSHCLAADMLELADRIEKAHNREQEDVIAATVVEAAKSASEVYEPHIKSAESVGNSAKMRKALLEIHNQLKERLAGEIPLVSMELRVKNIINSALSDTPRNCDLYTTELEAWRAFTKEMENTPKEEHVYFETWLFAEVKSRGTHATNI